MEKRIITIGRECGSGGHTIGKLVAERLGIAVSTVSKGLNGASDISEETRQLVLDTAVEMVVEGRWVNEKPYRHPLL